MFTLTWKRSRSQVNVCQRSQAWRCLRSRNASCVFFNLFSIVKKNHCLLSRYDLDRQEQNIEKNIEIFGQFNQIKWFPGSIKIMHRIHPLPINLWLNYVLNRSEIKKLLRSIFWEVLAIKHTNRHTHTSLRTYHKHTLTHRLHTHQTNRQGNTYTDWKHWLG